MIFYFQKLYLEVCRMIKIQTTAYGDENSYQMSKCASEQKYGNNQEYKEKCCLAPGTYTLNCKCSYGDGWHGGFIEIDGVVYCKNFMSAPSMTVNVTWT